MVKKKRSKKYSAVICKVEKQKKRREKKCLGDDGTSARPYVKKLVWAACFVSTFFRALLRFQELVCEPIGDEKKARRRYELLGQLGLVPDARLHEP